MPESETLQRVERLQNGHVVLLRIRAIDAKDGVCIRIDVEAQAPITADEEQEILGKGRWMLKLDEDLSDFYELAARFGKLGAIVEMGRGRLLRSSTLWEDVVKTIATTNVTWRNTVNMIARLVHELGDPLPGSGAWRAFPSPARVVEADPELFAREIRMGYRNEYVIQLAHEIVSGERELEALTQAVLPAAELKKSLKSIKGVGEYAANTLMMLLGHYGGLAIDSEMRSFVTRHYFAGEPATDKQIAAIYEDWGDWKYLAYWFDASES